MAAFPDPMTPHVVMAGCPLFVSHYFNDQEIEMMSGKVTPLQKSNVQEALENERTGELSSSEVEIFDSQPADGDQHGQIHHRSGLRAALVSIANAFQRAAQWISGLAETLQLALTKKITEPKIEISAPRFLKSEPINFYVHTGDLADLDAEPADPLPGINTFEELDRHNALEAFKNRVDPQRKFITSANDYRNIPLINDSRQEAFDAYINQCEDEGKPFGEAACSAEMRHEVLSFAADLINLVILRKQHAAEESKEFWLPHHSQQLLQIAIRTLESHGHSKAVFESLKQPINPISTAQQNSFMAWKDWKNKKASEITDQNMSIEAALVYAHFLIQKHGGRDEKIDSNLSELVKSAHELMRTAAQDKDEFNAHCLHGVLNSIASMKLVLGQDDVLALMNNSAPVNSDDLAERPSPPIRDVENSEAISSVDSDLERQKLSFVAWTEWQADRSYLPEQSGLAINPAVEYAKSLLKQVEGKGPEILSGGGEILRLAADLVAHQRDYEAGFNQACADATLRNEVNEQSRKILQAGQLAGSSESRLTELQTGSAGSALETAEQTVKPTRTEEYAPPQAASSLSSDQAPTGRAPGVSPVEATKPQAVSPAHIQEEGLAPAPPPTPLDAIPKLNSLGSGLIKQANELFLEFYNLYTSRRNDSNFKPDHKFQSVLLVSAAMDYRARIMEGEINSPKELQYAPAAEWIIKDYLSRQTSQSKARG